MTCLISALGNGRADTERSFAQVMDELPKLYLKGGERLGKRLAFIGRSFAQTVGEN